MKTNPYVYLLFSPSSHLGLFAQYIVDWLQFVESGSIKIAPQKFKDVSGQRLLAVSNKYGYVVAATPSGEVFVNCWRTPNLYTSC